MKKQILLLLTSGSLIFFAGCNKDEPVPDKTNPGYHLEAECNFSDANSRAEVSFFVYSGDGTANKIKLDAASARLNNRLCTAGADNLYTATEDYPGDASLSVTAPDGSSLGYYYRQADIADFTQLPVAVSFSKSTGVTLNIPGPPLNTGETVTVMTLSFGHFFPSGSQSATGATTVTIPPNSTVIEPGNSTIYFIRSKTYNITSGNVTGKPSKHTISRSSTQRPCTISA